MLKWLILVWLVSGTLGWVLGFCVGYWEGSQKRGDDQN